MERKKILVVDVDPIVRSGINSFLSSHGLLVSDFSNCEDAETCLPKCRPDAAVLDLYLPNGDAPRLLQRLKSLRPAIPVIVLSGRASAEAAAKALRMGADQVIVKPVELEELHGALLRATGAGTASAFVNSSRSNKREYPNPFVGTSAAIRRLREVASRVLAGQSPILLHGETGSGKGVLANWIHRSGPRSHQPFLDLNCAGLSRELLESELFGYEKGAFTSASASKPGLLEIAHHGTVFLDEIGDIDLQVQPKLLKVLEERTLRRLGDIRDRSVDIRLISATHRDLLELVRRQRFRDDLYFRVNIFSIHVPALRERVEDIRPLAEQILCSLNREELRISNASMQLLQQYSWPGNIRELRNVLERAALLAEHNVITPEQLDLQCMLTGSLDSNPVLDGTLEQVERAYIRRMLQAEAGSVGRTARRLGIPRSSLYNKMRRFAIAQGTGRLRAELPNAD